MPIGNPLGFTNTLLDAGRFSVDGVSVIQGVPPAMTAVYATALLPDETFSFWATGSVAPTTQTNDSVAGVGVSTGACAAAGTAIASAMRK